MLAKPVYEALPVVYIVAGATTVASLQSPFATASAVLFFTSAVLVGKWRHDNRKQSIRPARRTKRGPYMTH
jgi:hypothetical protein